MNIPSKFKRAREAAKNSDHRQHKMGAAVFFKGKFLAVGFNSLKTHPIMRRFDRHKTIHAEIHALTKAKAKKFDIANATVFIYRETKEGNLANAKPCSVCMNILKEEFQVRNVIFTVNNGWGEIRV